MQHEPTFPELAPYLDELIELAAAVYALWADMADTLVEHPSHVRLEQFIKTLPRAAVLDFVTGCYFYYECGKGKPTESDLRHIAQCRAEAEEADLDSFLGAQPLVEMFDVFAWVARQQELAEPSQTEGEI